MAAIQKYAKLIFVLTLAAFGMAVWSAVFYWESHRNLAVTFFDVGQGDSIFIQSPSGNQILVDGGPGTAILPKIGAALPFWDRSIDLLVLTHPHADHLDGLLEVLKRYRVGMVLESGVEHSIPEYHEWHELLQGKHVPVITARVGERVEAGRGVVLDIFSPFENFSGVSVKNPHDANIVSRLSYGSTSILLMGDAEKPIEYRLLMESSHSGFLILDSDILKVGHHGSKTSTVQEFLDAVSPRVAVIQVGKKNRYGHPHPEVLDRLTARGLSLLRTDIHGDIQIASDGRGYRVEK